MKKIIICDIDGTIADCSHRLHYIQGDKKDWERFYDEVDKDETINVIIEMIKTLRKDYKIIFVTGRNIICYKKTYNWIFEKDLALMSYDLLMRKHGDYRPDTEVKQELLKKYLKYNPDSEVAFILEDRNSMVKKWRELGYTCLQVCEGKY